MGMFLAEPILNQVSFRKANSKEIEKLKFKLLFNFKIKFILARLYLEFIFEN